MGNQGYSQTGDSFYGVFRRPQRSAPPGRNGRPFRPESIPSGHLFSVPFPYGLQLGSGAGGSDRSCPGEEAADQGVDILLGPGLNIKRNPLCGRNFEYFSEDPYFSGKMAAAFIRGVESQGIAACPKHFAVNSQELRRMTMNAVVDERTLREIYLTGFETAIKEGKCRALMTSYNQVNGIYANEHPHLLKEILRKEWGFCGAVITDWGGSNDHCAGVKNGSSLEMPAPRLKLCRSAFKGE